jgi:hypothetical protein
MGAVNAAITPKIIDGLNVFVCVEEGDWPYMDGPFIGRIAAVTAFAKLEAALEYRDTLVEEKVVTKNQVQIITMKMEGLMELIDELTVFAQEEYESGFEILLQEPEVVTTIYNSTQAATLN